MADDKKPDVIMMRVDVSELLQLRQLSDDEYDKLAATFTGTNESGHRCPGTLGQYKAVCVAYSGEQSAAVAVLNKKIATSANGEATVVVASDKTMRRWLQPLMNLPYRVGEVLPPLPSDQLDADSTMEGALRPTQPPAKC